MDSTENMIIFKAFESAQESPKAHRGFTLNESESSNVDRVHNLSKQTFGISNLCSTKALCTNCQELPSSPISFLVSLGCLCIFS